MNVITLLRLEIKNRFGTFSLSNGKAWLKLFSTLIFAGAAVVGFFYVSKLLFEMFFSAGLGYEILVILFTALFLVLTFTGISSTIKVLYYKGDNEILMRFPVQGGEVFTSKTLFLIVSQFALTAIVLIPMLFAYGEVVGVDGRFFRSIPVVFILLVLIPFFLSNILAIPIMKITNRIRNKFTLILISMSVIMTAMFAAYMFLFDKMVVYMNGRGVSVFDGEVVEIITYIAQYIVPTRYFADILVGKDLFLAYPVLIMLVGICLAATIIIIVKLYPRTLIENVEVDGSAFKHVTRNKKRPIFVTLFKKEFINVFRSVNYSFQYFVLACSMPVMVYFCNKISLELGVEKIGDKITVGMSLLVMLIFAAVITSFAATSVSREGDNFYHTKVAPVSIQKQLFVKFFMYLIVSVAANAICLGVFVFTKQMDWKLALWVFAIVQSISIGLTLLSMRMDIMKPYFNLSGEGEIVNSNVNTTASIGAGFAIAIIEGMLAMIFAYLVGNTMWVSENTMYIVCSAVAAAFTIGCVLFYSIKLKRAYYKISR